MPILQLRRIPMRAPSLNPLESAPVRAGRTRSCRCTPSRYRLQTTRSRPAKSTQSPLHRPHHSPLFTTSALASPAVGSSPAFTSTHHAFSQPIIPLNSASAPGMHIANTGEQERGRD
ncbi:hypothetical protein FS749_007505 [Ceratobasidium sp. UAMH 11750]|nr:hypothetical protein FS749_007505 [Ceratobasidium sp. UAMH 11750]